MPSSLIFTGLVVLWLLILVPTIARRQQEVARPSPAALSGRVLSRPSQRRRDLEVNVDEIDETRGGTIRRTRVRAARADTDVIDDARDGRARDGRVWDDHGQDGGSWGDDCGDDSCGGDPSSGDRARDDHPWEDADLPDVTGGPDDQAWQRPPSRYRPGRGGFDPEAAALTARARYAIRRRIVAGLLIAAVVTALAAAFVTPGVWWLCGGIVTALVGYLVYLRRQVRMEEAIRSRRTARMAGTRRPAAADDPELDGWARRGLVAAGGASEPDQDHEAGTAADTVDESEDDLDLGPDDEGDRVPGTGEPLGMLPGRPRAVPDSEVAADQQIGLPVLPVVELPAVPPGTLLVEFDESDPDQHELGGPARPDYRRAVGE